MLPGVRGLARPEPERSNPVSLIPEHERKPYGEWLDQLLLLRPFGRHFRRVECHRMWRSGMKPQEAALFFELRRAERSRLVLPV